MGLVGLAVDRRRGPHGHWLVTLDADRGEFARQGSGRGCCEVREHGGERRTGVDGDQVLHGMQDL